jgi:hypothetical protein
VIDEFRRYGWHWYIVEFSSDASHPEHAIAAISWGGQRPFGLPSDDLVVAQPPWSVPGVVKSV